MSWFSSTFTKYSLLIAKAKRAKVIIRNNRLNAISFRLDFPNIRLRGLVIVRIKIPLINYSKNSYFIICFSKNFVKGPNFFVLLYPAVLWPVALKLWAEKTCCDCKLYEITFSQILLVTKKEEEYVSCITREHQFGMNISLKV